MNYFIKFIDDWIGLFTLCFILGVLILGAWCFHKMPSQYPKQNPPVPLLKIEVYGVGTNIVGSLVFESDGTLTNVEIK